MVRGDGVHQPLIHPLLATDLYKLYSIYIIVCFSSVTDLIAQEHLPRKFVPVQWLLLFIYVGFALALMPLSSLVFARRRNPGLAAEVKYEVCFVRAQKIVTEGEFVRRSAEENALSFV